MEKRVLGAAQGKGDRGVRMLGKGRDSGGTDMLQPPIREDHLVYL